jgi:hypothetical protein
MDCRISVIPMVIVLASAGLLPQQPPAGDAAKPAQVTLTGCLRSSAADPAIAGPSGRLYTLEVTDATAMVPPGAPAPVTGVASSVATTTTYSLAVDDSLALEQHADHKVQLTGRLQTPSSDTSRTTGSPSPSAGPAPKPGGAHNTFVVSRLEMVAAKCP